MRCQQLLKKVGWGTKRCPRDAAPGKEKCTRCLDRDTAKHAAAALIVIGQGGSFPNLRDPEFREWIKKQPCLFADRPDHICKSVGNRWRIEACHHKTRGSAGADIENLFPVDPTLHDEQEGRSREFEARYQINLTEICAQFYADYKLERFGPVEAAR